MNQSVIHAAFLTRPRLASFGVAAAVLVACCAILAVFSRDVAATLATWSTSSAYSYCVLIAPISLYLIYSRRAELSAIEPELSLTGAGILLGCLGVWWLGMAASITELRQFAIVGMIQAAVLCLLGWRMYRRILFPMLYLFLMVPSATALLGPLQTLTTMISSFLLGLAGIPVLGENHLIEVPHGLYQVAPGCAGLNFLLSTLALSLIYAGLIFRSRTKRVVVVVVALLLSIATNAVRVFGIIWLAEATDRRIDIVDDHLLYGWGVYCVVMLAAMYVGFRFRDPPEQQSKPAIEAKIRTRPARLWLAVLAIAISVGVVQASYHSPGRSGGCAGLAANGLRCRLSAAASVAFRWFGPTGLCQGGRSSGRLDRLLLASEGRP